MYRAVLVVACLVAGACAPQEDQGDAPAVEAPALAPPSDDEELAADRDGSTDAGPTDDGPTDDGSTDDGSPPATAIPTPPEPYQLHPDEIAPGAKRAAVEVVERLTTYEPDESLDDVVASISPDARLHEHLLEAAAPLHRTGTWSRGEIVYPQLGGLGPRQVSVMTVVRRTVGEEDGEVLLDETRVLDVRVELIDGAWRLEALASAGGEPVPRPDDLGPAADAVLDDDRIELPDTVRWDIHRGTIDERLLRVMARLAERAPYRVAVLDTGHPWEVFGTDRQSNHSRGRAVDVFALDGSLVLEQQHTGSQVHALVRWLYDQPEVAELGSPWALDGFGGRSFTDDLHRDHLHIGVR